MIDKRMSNLVLEEAYDLIATAVDQAGPEKEALFLAKLALALANTVDDNNTLRDLIAAASRDL